MNNNISAKNLRILQVLGSLNMGGAESRIMDVFRHLDHDKIQFDFLIFQDGPQVYEQEAQELGAAVIRRNMPRARTILSHIRELRKVIRAGHYHAVHAHTSYHSGLVMFAAWLEKIPVRITHARTTGTKRDGQTQKLMIWFGKQLIKHFATERFAISDAAGRYLFADRSYTVLPNAIEVSRYQGLSADEKAKLRLELQLSPSSFVIGQIGRFDPMKNHTFSLHWFSQYRKMHPDAKLVFVGDGLLRKEVESLADELGLRDHLRFTGIRKDAAKLIQSFDIILLPSIFEGLAGVVLEAQAAGIPSVISDTVPTEADFGLDLVRRCSLTAGFEDWSDAVDAGRGQKRTDYNNICAAFEQRGFSLIHEIDILCAAYLKGQI